MTFHAVPAGALLERVKQAEHSEDADDTGEAKQGRLEPGSVVGAADGSVVFSQSQPR